MSNWHTVHNKWRVSINWEMRHEKWQTMENALLGTIICTSSSYITSVMYCTCCQWLCKVSNGISHRTLTHVVKLCDQSTPRSQGIS